MSDPNKIVVKPTFSTQTIKAAASIRAMTGGAGGAVSSVNGQTGAVVLGAADVGALPISTVIPAVASSGTPAMDGTASRGSSAQYARADHVHPTDTSRLAANQGTANAGKFMVVGSDGVVAPVAMSEWQGGSY